MEPTKTRRFDPSPCVMLVAMDDALAKACTDALKSLPAAKSLQIMRVAHIRAACERMLVTRPLIVAFVDALGPDDRKLLVERAQDIMAEIVTIPANADGGALKTALLAAVRASSTK